MNSDEHEEVNMGDDIRVDNAAAAQNDRRARRGMRHGRGRGRGHGRERAVDERGAGDGAPNP